MGASNPLVAQGTLNRLRGSVVIAAFPNLNVTAPYLGREGIRLALNGETTTRAGTMTGVVTSPQPYQDATVTLHLLKTNGLGDAYKQQIEALTTIGDLIVYPDTSSLGNYSFSNCSINGVAEMSFAGEDPVMTVTLGGIYYINAELWQQN
jgi:hypothetical protein